MGDEKRKRYDAASVITLPRISAHECNTLAQRLLTRAESSRSRLGNLPELVEYARANLSSCHQALAEALQPVALEDTAAAQAADREEDECWRLFRKWLEAFVGISAQGNEDYLWARDLNNLVFGEGMNFTTTSYQEQWSQTQSRIDAISAGGYTPAITRHGGQPLYNTLCTAHEKYGQVLGITSPVEAEPSPEIGAYMDATRNAIKDYVMKVGAQVRADRPRTQEMVDFLMVPLAEWDDPTSASSPETNDPALPHTPQATATP